jgi:hypothetical protein
MFIHDGQRNVRREREQSARLAGRGGDRRQESQMTGERDKTPSGEPGGEPRSFAPRKPGETSEVGAMRQDMGEDPGDLAASDESGMAGDAGDGADPTSGAGVGSVGATGAPAGGDAHLGKDGRKLGDPMNARRQIPSSGATGGIGGGSGAD